MAQLREVIGLQHQWRSVEECYVHWLLRYIWALRPMPEGLSSEKKLEAFLTQLALRDDVDANTQNQAFDAVVLFYRDILIQPLRNVDRLRAKGSS